MAIGRCTVSLEEFLTWPEQEPPLELIDGVVRPKMSPSLPHAALQTELTFRLNGWARPRGLGRAYSELRTNVGRHSPVPDLVFYRQGRVGPDPSGQLPTYPTVPPDIAVEVASPGQGRASVERRCAALAAAGVSIVLLVWPPDESVTRFSDESQPRRWSGGDRIELEPVLPGFELTVRELFDAAYGR
jgi:Uma2 family endonuclease